MRRLSMSGCWFVIAMTASAGVLSVPGEGWRKVRLSYEAKVTDDATYEAHPEYEVMPGLAPMHVCRITLEPKPAEFCRGIGCFGHFVWSSDWRTYVRELWIPPGAKKLTATFPNEKGVKTRNFKLTAVEDGAIVVNGDFGLGPYNSSGFAVRERNGRIEPGADGHGVLNTCPDGAMFTEPFPLAGGAEYRVITIFRNVCNVQSQMRMCISYFDVEGRRLHKDGKSWYVGWWQGKGVARPDWIVATNTVVVGSAVSAASLGFYEGEVKAYRIEKVRNIGQSLKKEK